MAHEQLPPVYAWSYKYVAAALPPQAGVCDPLLGAPGARRRSGGCWWRRPLITGRIHRPSGADPFDGRLPRAGEVLELTLTGDFVVTVKRPLLMTQGIDCEPSLSLAISADKLLEDLTFAVLPSFDQMMAVARMGKDGLSSTDRRDPRSMFLPAGGGSRSRASRCPCPPGQQVCTHRLQGLFGMTLRGMDVPPVTR